MFGGAGRAAAAAPRGRAHWRGQVDRQRRGTGRHTFDLDQLGTGQQQPGQRRQHLEVWRTGVACPGRPAAPRRRPPAPEGRHSTSTGSALASGGPASSGSASRSGALVWRGQADRQRRGTGLQRQKAGTRPRPARRSPAAARRTAAAPRGLAHWCGVARLTGSAAAPAGTPSTSTSSAPASSSPASSGGTSRSGALVRRGQADRQRRGTGRHTFDLAQLGTGQQQPGQRRQHLGPGALARRSQANRQRRGTGHQYPPSAP